MITHSISRYIKLKNARKNCPMRFSSIDGKTFYHAGQWLPWAEFETYYPKVEYRKFNEKGINPNRKMDSLI